MDRVGVFATPDALAQVVHQLVPQHGSFSSGGAGDPGGADPRPPLLPRPGPGDQAPQVHRRLSAGGKD